MRSRAVAAAILVAALTGLASDAEARQMPNPRQMSGVPLPVGDVPAGTVTVRVLRGSFDNPVASQTVELEGDGQPKRATTNEIGRAEFTGLAPGARVKARAVVGSERLESQEFAVPASGGIRVMLVAAPAAAGGSDAGQAAAPAQPGRVVFGDDSRFVFELGEDGLSVFYILQIQNASAAPVQPEQPVAFELPPDARGATILEGSSPQATVSGRNVQVAGPFAPGRTLVQVAYTLPYSGAEIAIEQRLPLELAHVAVVAQKLGDLRLSSPHVREQQDMPAQGNLYIAGRGGAVAAGEPLRFTFSGVPHHPTWPRTVALVLAGLVLAAGAWSSFGARGAREPHTGAVGRLEARRDRLFDDLASLEMRHREGAVDSEQYAERRRELVASLERVYVALDDDVAARRAS